MAVAQKIRICSFNMHRFNNSESYLHNLCSSNDMIFVQEHWLLSSQLHKFDNIHSDFGFYGCSSLDKVCSQGLLCGRPYGGVGVLYRKNLSSNITVVGQHDEGRAIAISLVLENQVLLLFGVYMPCDDGTAVYRDRLCDIFGFVDSVVDAHSGYK